MTIWPRHSELMVREHRRNAGLTQAQLAMLSDTGVRFIIDLESGKPSCQLGKALRVGETLGIKIQPRPDDADVIMPDLAP